VVRSGKIATMRWSPAAVGQAAGGAVVMPVGSAPRARMEELFAGVSIDSRELASGALFVALRAVRDGHQWIDAALDAGAGGLLVDRTWQAAAALPAPGVPTIGVDDTAAALLAIGSAARDRLTATVTGITGSVGKTSTKDLAAAALSAARRTVASERSFNNELGVPLTLANAPTDVEAAVIEMGARGPGHISRLCRVARPVIGVVTAVVAAHTETFGDLDAVAAAKAELVHSLPAGGTAILNADDPRVAAMATQTAARVLRYSTGRSTADVVADRVALDDQLRPRFVVRSPWGTAAVQLEARGAHQVGNALAALAVGLCCGVPLDAAVGGLSGASLSPWRMELLRSPTGATILNDAYNANPTSMTAALEALAALPARRRVAVLGEMAELGARSGREHQGIAGLAGRLGVEVLAVGTTAYGGASVATIDEAVAALGPLGGGDAVLVKGSRVAGLERLAARLVSRPGSSPAGA
jgi:UDP-N-acetylmuramoyl-tripeptide--D-alanyl-D-alanine ligase